MRVYLDSSALIKRAVLEVESEPLAEEIDRLYHTEAMLVSTSLAWTEVARVLRTRTDIPYREIADDLRTAMSGIAEHPLDAEIMNLSRRVEPAQLRSLDAIHLAAAVALDVDLMITYDARLAEASTVNGIPVSAPS